MPVRRTARRLALAASLALVAACSPTPSSDGGSCQCLPGDTCLGGRCVAGTSARDGGSDGGSGGGNAVGGSLDGGTGTGGGGGALACVLPPVASSGAAAPTQVVALGTRRVGSTVTFAVPAGTASVTVVEQAVSAPASVTLATSGAVVPNAAVPLRVVDAQGRKLYDDLVAAPQDGASQLVYGGVPSAVVGTLLLPNSSAGLDLVAGGLAAGTWSAVVSDYAYECSIATGCTTASASDTSQYDVQVVLKPGSGAAVIPTAGRVDVTFHLTPGNIQPPLSASTAAADADLQRMVRTLATLLSRAGVTLGNVAYVDVPRAVADQVANGVDLDDQSACGELARLLASGTPGRQVNLFLVPDFTARDVPPNAVLAGVDGTIPAPATVAPTVASGAAVGVIDLRHASGTAACRGGFNLACGADQTALVTAHEMGHFFGLFHTTEQEGDTFDPLSDTATCACASCATSTSSCGAASTPHLMSVAECTRSTACGGGDNLMFWLIDQGSTGQLTAQQGKVIRASAAVY